jgi:hypothetical protein
MMRAHAHDLDALGYHEFINILSVREHGDLWCSGIPTGEKLSHPHTGQAERTVCTIRVIAVYAQDIKDLSELLFELGDHLCALLFRERQ